MESRRLLFILVLPLDTCTLIGVHSTMHLVDPLKVHAYGVCVCVCVCVCSLLLGNPNFKDLDCKLSSQGG